MAAAGPAVLASAASLRNGGACVAGGWRKQAAHVRASAVCARPGWAAMCGRRAVCVRSGRRAPPCRVQAARRPHAAAGRMWAASGRVASERGGAGGRAGDVERRAEWRAACGPPCGSAGNLCPSGPGFLWGAHMGASLSSCTRPLSGAQRYLGGLKAGSPIWLELMNASALPSCRADANESRPNADVRPNECLDGTIGRGSRRAASINESKFQKMYVDQVSQGLPVHTCMPDTSDNDRATSLPGSR